MVLYVNAPSQVKANFYKPVLCSCCGGTGKRDEIDGAALRAVRVKVGVSVWQLAKQLGFSAAYLSDIELGKRGCSARIEQVYERLYLVVNRV